MLCMGQVYVVGEVGIIEELELKGHSAPGRPRGRGQEDRAQSPDSLCPMTSRCAALVQSKL